MGPQVTTALETQRLCGALGVQASGVSLAGDLEERAFAHLLERLNYDSLLLIRNQALTPQQLTAFAARFGELVPALPNEYGRLSFAGLPIEVISNVIENGQEIGSLGASEASWHTDMSMYELPSSYTFLYALEVPSEGGDTYFADMAAAYDDLPEHLRSAVEGRQANHASSYLSGGQLRPGHAPVTDVRSASGSRHPIVRTHPVTGRKALYLGRRRAGWIVGLPVMESDSLLDALWGHMTKPEFVYRHKWQVGDLVIWDNRSLIHRRDAFDSSLRRIMLRLTVRGERPI